MASIECACGALNEIDAKKCWRCKAAITFEQYEKTLAIEEAERKAQAAREDESVTRRSEEIRAAESAFALGRIDEIPQRLHELFAGRVPISTSPFIHGREIAETVDIVTAECVFGMNVFKDFFMAVSDVFGGRNKSAQAAFREARIKCLAELRKEALATGGNAIVSVDLDYSEISGGGKGMLFLVASGTVVKLAPAKG